MGMGYDIGVSFSGSSSAAANLNSPFSVTGGGGSGKTGSGLGEVSDTAVLTSPKLLPWLAIAGVIVLLALVVVFKRKKS
jgi:LPXTG-motif cell wall-anchored protein